MEFIYPFLISFAIVFVSELGDKTQLLVLSFSRKDKTFRILLGVAIGSFFSHGLAILFGSSLSLFSNPIIHQLIELITYFSFVIIGVLTLLPKKEKLVMDDSQKNNLLLKISNLKINYCLLIALYIAIGEFGDKTFLASIGLGVQYPNYKICLIIGAITAMVASDSIAIAFGKFLNNHISENAMQKLSGILFLIFGFIGLFLSIF